MNMIPFAHGGTYPDSLCAWAISRKLKTEGSERVSPHTSGGRPLDVAGSKTLRRPPPEHVHAPDGGQDARYAFVASNRVSASHARVAGRSGAWSRAVGRFPRTGAVPGEPVAGRVDRSILAVSPLPLVLANNLVRARQPSVGLRPSCTRLTTTPTDRTWPWSARLRTSRSRPKSSISTRSAPVPVDAVKPTASSTHISKRHELLGRYFRQARRRLQPVLHHGAPSGHIDLTPRAPMHA
jgi:hypothetical protein